MTTKQDTTLSALLWSLKEDVTWAHKVSLNGGIPDMFEVGKAWKLVEQELTRLDQLKGQQ